MIDLENEFPYHVKVPMHGGKSRKETLFFWLWQQVGNCPKCPMGYRIPFAEKKLEKKTKEIMWKYVGLNSGNFYFKNKSDAVLFRLRWAD